jgi:hypothetical protein
VASSPAADAVAFLENGAAAVQVATRFTVSKECGLPENVQQEYFKAGEDDIEVNTISPTGYPMRMLKSSPAIGDGIRPNCEAYGYLLDSNGKCQYIEAYNREVALHPGARKVKVMDKTCLCTHMRNFEMLDLRPLTYRLKDTTRRNARRQLRLLSRGTHLPRLPVQHRQQDRAAGLTPARAKQNGHDARGAALSGREYPGRQIAVTAIADDADDHRVLHLLGDAQRHHHRAARRDAGKDALLLRQSPRHVLGVALTDVLDLVDPRTVVDFRQIGLRPFADAGNLRAFLGLAADDLDGRILFLEEARYIP